MPQFLTIAIALLFAQPADPAQSYLVKGQSLEEAGYLAKALEAYTKANDPNASEKIKAAAMSGMASVLAATGEYDSVTSYLNHSRDLDSSPENLIINYQAEARYRQSQNEYDQALASLQLAKDNAEKINDKKSIAIILGSIGSIYFSHQPDKSVARNYFLQSNEICDSTVHYNIIARNYGRLANVAMNLNDGPTAKAYLDRAYKIVQLSNNLPVKAYIISSLAILHSEDDLPAAIRYLEESMGIKRQLGQVRSLQNDLLNISEAYMEVKDYSKSERSLAELREISTSLNDHVYLKYYYERASVLDSVLGNYKGAYSNYKRAMAYKDSTFSSQHFRDVREIQEKYEAEQKEKIIAEKELEIEHQKYRQALILGTVLIAALTFTVLFIVRRSQNKKQQDQLRLQTIVKTQEEVQQRIARDLHDGLVQVLGAAKMSLQSIGPDSDRAVLQKHIRNASDIVDEAVTEARSISHQVLPYSLLKDGLISALEELFARSLSSFEFDHDDSVDASEEIVINIYRIAQELVNNVQKHASSARVVASLKSTGKQLLFVFADNGQGFDINHVKKGAGLSNITTRAELIGGTIVMRSIPGKGTTTELTIPL